MFFDSGSGPSWVKQRCIKRFNIQSFTANKPARVSGVGKGIFFIKRDCILDIGLVSKDSSDSIWIQTAAGVVPDTYQIPCDILVGRGMLEKLGAQHTLQGDLILNAINSRPRIFPITNSSVFPIEDLAH